MALDGALGVAEKLLQSATTEDEFRAVASRAYMAAFQHAIRHQACSGYSPTNTGGDHAGLIAFCLQHTDTRMQRLGRDYLRRLRAIRNLADYNLQFAFTRELAAEAIDRAYEVIYEFLP